MSAAASRPFVKATDGLVHITNLALDFDEVETLLAEYRAADDLADQDWYARRYTHHSDVTRPAAESAADDVRETAGFRLTWQEAMALSDALMVAAANARRAEVAVEVGASLDRASVWFRNNDRAEAQA